jgi:acyl-CoA reductase-like NAD-dependent aldehyde dehydrogenase
LTGMKLGMLISKKETFGPVAASYKFDTEDKVVHMANDTEWFGQIFLQSGYDHVEVSDLKTRILSWNFSFP